MGSKIEFNLEQQGEEHTNFSVLSSWEFQHKLAWTQLISSIPLFYLKKRTCKSHKHARSQQINQFGGGRKRKRWFLHEEYHPLRMHSGEIHNPIFN